MSDWYKLGRQDAYYGKPQWTHLASMITDSAAAADYTAGYEDELESFA